MAADVSSLVRILNGYLDEQRAASSNSNGGGSSTDLITRDLFGSSATSSSRIGSKDIDLDLQVPSGWEKRLDLKSGKVYLQRCNSPISSSSTTTSSSDHQKHHQKHKQDLNFLPGSVTKEDDSLDLKLVQSYDYRSVCTLDKVKSALERAGKDDSGKKRSSSISSLEEEEEEGSSSSTSSGLLFAGGCPSCLMYVMISKLNPKCPRCDSIVPIPPAMCSSSKNKKPKLNLDLNLNLLSSSS